MQRPPKPDDEADRLRALGALNVLDSAPEERFDRITRLAKRLFGVPIVLVSLVDENRQWFKSCLGLDVSETSRDISFCGHAILGDDLFMVPDTLLDERFSDNPLVTGAPHIRFYAGVPLKVRPANRVGTLCIIDREPRELDQDEQALLRDLAGIAEQELAALHLATTDELTTLANRRGFEAYAQHALSVCKRIGRSALLVFVDLNRFKQINDRFGHGAGDRALCEFARMLQLAFRRSDVVGRLGGDEFAVLLTDTNRRELDHALERLQESVRGFNRDSQSGYEICYSAGAVEYDASRHADIADMLAEADKLMYQHKQASRSA